MEELFGSKVSLAANFESENSFDHETIEDDRTCGVELGKLEDEEYLQLKKTVQRLCNKKA